VTDRPDAGGGGLTGATGDLTHESTDRPFVPAERREMEDHQGEVTASPARQSGESVPDGDPLVAGDVTELAQADGGYGSGAGLSGEDPAYRMEKRPVHPPERGTDPPAEDVRPGVDVITDHEERL
jgi:hypothetical protein